MRSASYLIFLLYLLTTYGNNSDQEQPYSDADSVRINDNLEEVLRDTSSTPMKCYSPFSKCFPYKFFRMPIEFGKELAKSQFYPQSPEEIDVKLKLFTTKHRYDPIDFDLNSETELYTNDFFDPEKKTIIIIHGFLSSFDKSGWMSELKDLILQTSDCNVFALDWQKGANKIIYWQAVRNIETVASVLVDLLIKLAVHTGLQYQDVHIIGHSLGAHVASYTANLTLDNSKIHRITALDPAGPGFESMIYQLKPSLANYVEVLHTDYAEIEYVGFGLKNLTGNIDFFPNGGFQQPGCEKKKALYNLFKKGFVDGVISCNHGFATKLMLYKPDQLTDDCQFIGYACRSHQDFLRGLCTDCGEDGSKCAIYSGFRETQQMQEEIQNRPKQEYYFQTKKDPPYCFHHYGIRFTAENIERLRFFSYTLVIHGSKDSITYESALTNLPEKPANVPAYKLHLRENNIGVINGATMKFLVGPTGLFDYLRYNIVINRLVISYMSNYDEEIRRKFSATLCSNELFENTFGSVEFFPCPDDRENHELNLKSLGYVPPIQVNHAATGPLDHSQQNTASNQYVASGYPQDNQISSPHYTGHPQSPQHRSLQVNHAGTGPLRGIQQNPESNQYVASGYPQNS